MKRNRWRRQAAVMLLLFSMVVTACSGSSGGGGTAPTDDAAEKPAGSETPAASEPAPAKPAEPVKLTMMRSGSGLPAPDKDVILQALNENLNMELEITMVPSEYEQQLNVKIAGGSPPDAFQVNKLQMTQYAKQGLLLDLTPYLKDMPNVTPENGFTEDHMKKGQVDGKQYSVPYRPLIPVQTTFWVRQDWLDKLGLKAPTTLDELSAVAKAFVEEDPDGNGKKDTIGITGNGFEGTLGPIFAAFGVAAPGHYMIQNGQVVYSTELPATRQAIEYIKGMIGQGLIDPEFLTNSGLAHQEKGFKGQAGIVYAHWAHMKRPDMVEKMNSINPNQSWTQLDAMTGPGGKFADAYDAGNTSYRMVIPKTLEKEPEKVGKLVEYFNYISGGEGQLLVNFGLEGRHYNLVDGRPQVIEETLAEVGHATIHQMTGRKELEYLNARFGSLKPYFEFANALPIITVYDGFSPIPEGVNPADKAKFESEELVKFIYGTRPTDEFPAFLQTLRDTFQLELYLTSASDELMKLGILK
ncbi:extracellular solute-binding protein [Paenibacillus antri]|nr:extracellular solute-binding protein [Paenibacillus antri]